jgi:hypothetical protein
VPLDPASWQILQRCLAHREAQRTGNPHVIVTKGTKAGRAPASAAYASHVLDGCGVPPRALRCTRLASLVNTIDPKLVAAAFGMNPEGVMFYLADHIDAPRLANEQDPDLVSNGFQASVWDRKATPIASRVRPAVVRPSVNEPYGGGRRGRRCCHGAVHVL